MEDKILFTIGRQKRIALIAHDGKKKELMEWCMKNKEILSRHFLCGTGTTAIGARIVEGNVDFVIFFSDPLEAQPHDPDVKALLRIAQVYDIPIANNRATADFMITSPYMEAEYEHEVINFGKQVAERAAALGK